MLIASAAILVGFIILIWSADLFVAGAASIAESVGLSPVIIGLTIVSLGTSAPEILVSITATMAGAGNLAIGNAIGSNIANVGLVLGTTVLIAPLCIHPNCLKVEMPMLLAVTLGTGLLLLDGDLSRLDGCLMLASLTFILIQIMRTQSKDEVLRGEAEEGPLPHLERTRAWITFSLGLLLLIGSSRLLVWGATEIAGMLGVSELIIGLTIVAIGTSLPELAATVASALRGHTEIAVGNVIGSNLFNLLAVMAIPGLLGPMAISPMVMQRDYAAMTIATVLLALAIYFGRLRKAAPPGHSYVGRSVGLLLLICYALYYYLLYLTV
ncbi:MAG: cation:H+ antiporter [Halieaceae bacterium]|jgi:cation:H+ antiporter